jgi:hypothetical protein
MNSAAPGVLTAASLRRLLDSFGETVHRERASIEARLALGEPRGTAMSGADYAKWVEKEEQRHRDLMKEAGFLATTN